MDPVGAVIVNIELVPVAKFVQKLALLLRGGRVRTCAGCATLTDVSENSTLFEYKDVLYSTLQVAAEPCEAGGVQISTSFTRSD